MFAPPPKVNKITLNSMDCKSLIDFYMEIGISFNSKTQEDNRNIYTYINDNFKEEN